MSVTKKSTESVVVEMPQKSAEAGDNRLAVLGEECRKNIELAEHAKESVVEFAFKLIRQASSKICCHSARGSMRTDIASTSMRPSR